METCRNLKMKVFAVIVTYNPDFDHVANLCKVLIQSNCNVVFVDNSGNGGLDKFSKVAEVSVLDLGTNEGIAHAQNVGIDYAVKQGADTIVFFDQDSQIELNFLSALLAPLVIGTPKVVASVFFDAKQGYEYPSFRFSRFGLLKKIYSTGKQAPYPVDVIISSGSAATIAVFDIAGVMDEAFFIDFVDIEWSIRCRRNNIPIEIVPQAIMRHSIGETSINLGVMRGFIHSAQRSYYKVRNPFLLLRKADIPKALAVKEIVAAMVHQLLFIFAVKKKQDYIKSYMYGILDGIKGITGKK
ncbi:rhamnosyltransferase [Pedobacter panaciterrae]|uniref:Rhamnosyltransferase n=1 Tax=Pedobacter panaciterrae TaxID=363849 RepID=A0ABU8NU52_9SPHI